MQNHYWFGLACGVGLMIVVGVFSLLVSREAERDKRAMKRDLKRK